MTSISCEMDSRTAHCGHTYDVPADSPGRRRKACPDCAPGRSAIQQAGKCRHCGSVVTKGESGPPRIYCTVKCRRDAEYARKKDYWNALAREENAARRLSITKDCPQCGETFSPRISLKQKFCGKACSRSYYRDASGRQCGEADCGRPLRARGMCSMHWRRWARAEGVEVNPKWDDRRRANYHKRRALKRDLPADDIRPADVYERDEWTCGLCSDAVPRDAKWPDPLSPSLDHVIPLAKGGHHVMENVQLAHLACNVRKGDRESVPA